MPDASNFFLPHLVVIVSCYISALTLEATTKHISFSVLFHTVQNNSVMLLPLR